MDDRMILANNVKEFRRKNKLSQEERAYQCGISCVLLSLIENCKDNVTLDTIQMLAARMNVTVADLFTENKIKYIVYPSVEENENKSYNSYGIAAIMNDIIVDYVNDVSIDFNIIANLVSNLNEKELSLEHLRDVAEDTYFQQT